MRVHTLAHVGASVVNAWPPVPRVVLRLGKRLAFAVPCLGSSLEADTVYSVFWIALQGSGSFAHKRIDPSTHDI